LAQNIPLSPLFSNTFKLRSLMNKSSANSNIDTNTGACIICNGRIGVKKGVSPSFHNLFTVLFIKFHRKNWYKIMPIWPTEKYVIRWEPQNL
jgi:hypothetical protein